MLEHELFDLLEGTADAAFSIDTDGEICSWNKAAEGLFGYTRAQALNKKYHNFLQPRGTLGTPICGGACSIRERAEKNAPVRNYDLEVKTRAGRRLWVNVSTLVYKNSRNQRRLFVHLAHDITERRKNEELLRKMAALSRRLSSLPNMIGPPAPVSSLSEQERRILHLFSAGRSSTDVAEHLGISVQTLRNHLHHINQKLHTHNRLEAVTHALQRRLV